MRDKNNNDLPLKMKTTRFAIIGGAGYTGTTTIKDLLYQFPKVRLHIMLQE